MTAQNPYLAGITDTNLTNVIGTPVSSSPWTVPQVWDTITLSGISYGPLSSAMTASSSAAAGQVPIGGKVRVRHAGRVYKFDKKDGPGQQGYTTTYIGIKPRLFAIDFFMWTSAQYEYYVNNVFPVLLNNGQNSSVQAISVQYPTLTQLGILSIFVESIEAIEEISDDRDKIYRQTVNVSEYIPPPPVNVTATPKGNKTVTPTGDGVQTTDFHQVAIQNQDRAIDELAQEQSQ